MQVGTQVVRAKVVSWGPIQDILIRLALGKCEVNDGGGCAVARVVGIYPRVVSEYQGQVD